MTGLRPFRHHTTAGVFFSYGFDPGDARERVAPYLPPTCRVLLTVPTEQAVTA